MVVRHGGLEKGFQGVNKGLLDVGDLQLSRVQASGSFHSLRTSLGLNANFKLGDDETVVCPALCAAHGLRNPHILPVPLPDDDIINEMPVF